MIPMNQTIKKYLILRQKIKKILKKKKVPSKKKKKKII